PPLPGNLPRPIPAPVRRHPRITLVTPRPLQPATPPASLLRDTRYHCCDWSADCDPRGLQLARTFGVKGPSPPVDGGGGPRTPLGGRPTDAVVKGDASAVPVTLCQRHGIPNSRRQNALDSGFHSVPKPGEGAPDAALSRGWLRGRDARRGG